MNTPILFLIFNRPATTKQVFEAIKLAQPKLLYIAADGPRPNSPDEIIKCQEARSILNNIDWDCEVKTLFRDSNLGCKKAVSEAITWFFDNVEEGIILEDDCLPSKSFFNYCETLLEKYRCDTRIMHISGERPINDAFSDCSYYFAQVPHIWGWATWRRAWNHYDSEMRSLSNFIETNKIKEHFYYNEAQNYWLDKFIQTQNGEINTWDYQWTYAILLNNGLCINSENNFIKNIGMDDDATHTTYYSPFFNRDTVEIQEIKHPETIDINKDACKKILIQRFGIIEKEKLNFHQKIFREIFRPFKRFLRDK